MKKLFRALSLCLTLALCVFGSTAALAEAPAATPAPQDQRVITDVSPLEDQIRNIVGFTTSTGGPYDFEQADHRSAVQAYGAKPAEGAVACCTSTPGPRTGAMPPSIPAVTPSSRCGTSLTTTSRWAACGSHPIPRSPSAPAATAGSTPASGTIWRLLQALSGRFLLPEHLCCPDLAGSGPAGRGQPQPCQI